LKTKLKLTLLIVFTICCTTASYAQQLTNAQIKQMEEIAQSIALQHNVNSKAMLDGVTVSSHAVANGRNVRIENILRVKKALPAAKLKEWSDATRHEILLNACTKSLAFERGLSYTFVYANTYGEKLTEFNVDKSVCELQ